MPTDNLIFGFCNTPNWLPNISFENVVDHRYEEGLADANVVLSPGAGKITLFGSLLQNGLPKQTGMNQPLTTPAVHEDIHYDIPVYDQFEVEPRSSMSGSYSDNIITGSMLATPLGSDIAQNVRRVQGSVANGAAGTTGSLQRFVRLTDTSGQLYDSYPPDLTKVFGSLGLGLLSGIGTGLHIIAPGTPDIGVLGPGIDNSWWLRTAYEYSHDRLIAGDLIQNRANAYPVGSSVSIGFRTANPLKSIYILGSTGLVDDNNFVTDDTGNRDSIESEKRSIKALWGFGLQKFNAPSFITQPNGGYTPSIHGYKYGLAGLFGLQSSAYYRRSRYGQFRDVLEQRLDTAVLGRANSLEYPIEITFKSREGTNAAPSSTHSQNLSTHATSSLPYYDGLAVERTDDPDTSLTAVDIVIS